MSTSSLAGREQELQEQRKRGKAAASTARSSTARQTQAFVTTSWQDLATAPGHSHARYARALGRLEVGVSSRVSETFQELPMPSKALPRASKKLPRASEASKSDQEPPTFMWQNVYNPTIFMMLLRITATAASTATATTIAIATRRESKRCKSSGREEEQEPARRGAALQDRRMHL